MASVEDIITKFAQGVTLAATVEGQLLPVLVGTILSIKKLAQGETIEYTIAIQTGKDNLAVAEQNFTTALERINKERVAAGLKPLDIPKA